MAVNSTRRYYLLKRLYARRACLEEDAWIGKQQALPGVVLPADFPSLAALVAAGYSTREDLDGAAVAELEEFAKLTTREAEAVIAALAAL